MQEFHIRRGSTLPVLRMELFMDGRYDFKRDMINDAIQDSVLTFTMKDTETGIFKIINADADILAENSQGCEERFILQYTWKDRDTKKPGIFEGTFEIRFNGNISDGYGNDYPEGNLIVPIQEKLLIYID